jgi:hypothetical protein
MAHKTFHKKSNILNLDEIRIKKKTATTQLLKDTKKMARAISTGTCVICNKKKSCVNKAGVCSYCFENVLNPEERLIAKEEAKHKIIKIQVLDDRWEKQ